MHPSESSIGYLDVLLTVASTPAQGAKAGVALLLLGVCEAGAALLAKVSCSRADGILGRARGSSATVRALTGERSPIVEAVSTLAGFRVTDSLVALLHISPSSRQRNHRHLVSSLHHQVKDAAGEPGVDGQIVRETGEVVDLVATNEELAVDVEVGEVAGGQAGDVWEVVHLHPAPPASPSQCECQI